jgi:NAD(P)-dependent dehydrogenase (short-subunit alcohol dehydrogenase family)
MGSSALVSELFSLRDRVAIVTGGAGQIGREVVRGLEEQGARVAVFDLEAEPYRVDVTDRAAIERAVEEVAQELGEPHVLVRVAARSFLHSMVRVIVGTLTEVGRGRREPSWVGEALAARDRAAAGPTAPPHGLTLWHVSYPDDVWL